MLRRWLAVVGLAGAVTATSAGARAESPSEADLLFSQGRELLERGQYAEACPKLARSEQLAPAVGTLLNLGYCLEQVGKMRSAMDAYSEAMVLAEKGSDTRRAAFARERFAAVESRVLRVIVRVVPPEAPGLEVRRNGQIVPKTDYGQAIPIDPEEIVVTASAPGREPWKGVVMSRGEGAAVTVFVPPLAEHAAPHAEAPRATLGPRRITALALGGGAALSIGAGVALGLAAKSRYDDSSSHCDGSGCDAIGAGIQHDAVTQGNVATALVGLGLLFAGAGAYLWFAGGGETHAASRPMTLGARF